MRLWQLWIRVFVCVIALLVAAKLLSAAGVSAADPATRALGSIFDVVAAGGGLLQLMMIGSVVVRSRRAKRAAAQLSAARADSPEAIVDAAFGPLVDARLARDLAVAVIVDGNATICFPRNSGRRADDGRLYEIGSLTKPMTAEILASMVEDGTATMTDRLGDYLPGHTLPAAIASITLEDLVTHRSGLPRIPLSPGFLLRAIFSSDPYAGMDREKLLASLARARRKTKLGTYSNFGFAVLGLALGERHGGSYREALEARVLRPLGLHDTRLEPDDDIDRRLLRGHDLIGVPTPRWHTNAMVAAGGVCMTIGDAARWLAAHLDPPENFRDVVGMVTEPRAPMLEYRIGMSWIIQELHRQTIVWHNGGTGGFSSFAGFDPNAKIGVVALASSFHIPALDRAGMELLQRWARQSSPSQDSLPK